jgi:hypothetical protein
VRVAIQEGWDIPCRLPEAKSVVETEPILAGEPVPEAERVLAAEFLAVEGIPTKQCWDSWYLFAAGGTWSLNTRIDPSPGGLPAT